MASLNINPCPAVGQVGQVGHFRKVFMRTVCALNIAKQLFAPLAPLSRFSAWRRGSA